MKDDGDVYRPFETLLVLGGGGLVGTQVCKRAARVLHPKRIILSTLFRAEAAERVEELSREFPEVEWDGYYGNVFLRGDPTPIAKDVATPSPVAQKADPKTRRQLFSDIFSDFDGAYESSFLVRLIHETRPTAIVDCINTATGISYQDVFLSSDIVARGLDEMRDAIGAGNLDTSKFDAFAEDVESLLISISVPELILHIRLLYKAMMDTRVRTYLKVGTTGTGGMGLNIPYTHGEDRPSPTLMTKTAIAFAQTGLLFLMARTAGAPIVKEVKPAAMIGYRDVEFLEVRGPQYRKGPNDRPVVEKGLPYLLYEPREQSLGSTFDTTPMLDEFLPLTGSDGSPETLRLAAVNTGENGIFTKGEFEAITYVDQMEFMTPEEIAEAVILELHGNNTGRDVISAIDSSVMSPTYKAGMIRGVALQALDLLEKEQGVPSIALGQLGPPQLAKYLYEAHLFREVYQTLDGVLGTEAAPGPRPEDISQAFFQHLGDSPLRNTIISIGIPVLHPDGSRIWRGPVVKIPAYNPAHFEIPLDGAAINLYATKGWVDLRPSHMQWWLDRFTEMRDSARGRSTKLSSERLTRAVYLDPKIRIGQVVAWLFNNKLAPAGHRIK